MTEPALAVSVPGRGRHYEHPRTGELVPSVTNVIQTLAKPWLAAWMAKEVAGYAWDNRMALLEIDDRDAAVDFLKGAGRRRRDAAANLGDVLHRVAEARASGSPEPEIDEAVRPYVASWEAFVRDWSPRWVATEVTMFHAGPDGYAGTADFIAEVGGSLAIGDYKTGQGVYEEAALQLAALRNCEEMWDGRELVPAPEVQRCLVVHIRPDGYAVREVRADADAYAAFIGLRRAWAWTTGEREPIGPPLAVPVLGAADG